ncbi:hypothetical protein [Bacillus sinesaloumensis]|nr:hypothetical protein [Bacillus sinesaloumensis]
MHRSPRIYSKMVKYSVILKVLGVLDEEDYNKIKNITLNENGFVDVEE